jgi:hypothetical protein
MKTVKAILTYPKSRKQYSKGYRTGYRAGKELGAIIVIIPATLIIGTLLALLIG